MTNLYSIRGWSVWITVWLLTVSQLAYATHIVGGELELQKLPAGNTFSHRVNLNLYFDDIYGNVGAKDELVPVYIFRKRDNAPMGTITLPRTSEQLVSYTSPTCSRGDLRTRLIRYSLDVTFPTTYNDAGGYYMSWERCCRNAAITNIQNPGGAGSVFYLEFPAPYTGTTPYTNSSPLFALAKGDYICINRPFTFDFSAKDPDGDSLTYTLVTPYNGFSTPTVPNPGGGGVPNVQSGPYPPIRWIAGLSERNEIPGSQPLTVDSRTGLLRVTADRLGLFVFSVEVGEYRRGRLIGLVRRDFQLKVVDCPVNDPPRLLLRPDGQKTFYQENTVLTLAESDTNCLNLFVTDPNANQRIQIINMSGSLPGLTLTPGELLTRTGKDTLQAKFCFGRCVGNGGPFTLLLRATDEGCPQGLSDTLSIRLNIIAAPNDKPAATTNLATNATRVTVGPSLSFPAFGGDPNNDNITVQAIGRGFALAQAGMSFSTVSGVGKASGPFTWKPPCSAATRGEYIVDFIVTDARCSGNLRDTVTVRLTAEGLPSQPPSVRTTLNQPIVDLIVGPADLPSGSSTFTVLGNDPDRDTLRMTATGRGFNYQTVGMNFTGKTGPPTLQSPFAWKPTCELMAGRAEATFVVDFVVDDGACQPKHTDTTTVTFRVKDPSVNAQIVVPNVFTPNGDGLNDYFAVRDMPENSCVEQFKSVDIQNRWGRSVFSSVDPKFRWLGTDAPAGTYYYLIQTTKRSFKGPLTLIR